LLIIDDQSPDLSIKICQQFTDPRIKIIHQENRGLAGARNTGIRHAKGDYLAFRWRRSMVTREARKTF
jgi:glycosyltransferase involved in cell wall biosynthesis